jgi:hypothetical protein
VQSGEAILIRWIKNDEKILQSRARIGKSNNWRIWSKVRARPGRWKIQLAHTEGRVIAERTFVVHGMGIPQGQGR